MSEADQERDPLEVLAAEFTQRQRSGESPSIARYVAQYPELAAEIQELFPAIAAMERLKVHKELGSGTRVSLGGFRLERLGDFRILGEIGRGGMGIVYEAFQESLGRHVAVKVLPRQSLLDAKQLQRFQREAQTAAKLHHTNIVPVFGVGEHEGFHYIVMQLIRGIGLDAVLGRLREVASCGAASPSLGEAHPCPAPTDRAGQDAGPPLLECRPSGEVTRLVRALVEGQFRPAHEFGLAYPQCPETAVPSREDQAAATGRSSFGGGAPARTEAEPRSRWSATEAFPGHHDTEISRSRTATSAVPETAAAPGQPWRLGPPYWRSAATIGLQVAEALGYAHAHHTLHRDVKPANLLLDLQGIVWITDFGLARAMEQDNVTQSGAIVGTLRYMAPEQLSGQFDARSDIYGLGLTLYELLTLQAAFEDTSRSSLIRKITQEEPTRPRKLNPRIPRDLETIVLKAIAREPADRYQSAAAMAHDLERFLEDRPIAARRASSVERLWRWSRRNRALASLAASSLVLLILVAVVASVGYVKTMRAGAEEARQRYKAEATSALALDVLDNIFQRFAPERTAPASALVVVGEAGEEIAVPVQPVLSKETASVLEHMLVFYDRLAKQGGDDARLRRKAAEANRRVGDIRQRLGHYEESKAAYLRAIELYTRLADASPEDTELRTEIARIHNDLGTVSWAMNEPEAAQASCLDALAILKATSAESSASPQYRSELARTYYLLSKRSGRQPGPALFALGGPPGPGPGPPGSAFPPPKPPRGRRGPPRGPSDLGFGPEGPPHGRGGPHGGEAGRPPSAFGPRGNPTGGGPPFPPKAPEAREDNLPKAIDLLEHLVAEYPGVPDYRHLLARCYREASIPWFGRRSGLPPDAKHKAVEMLQKLVEEFPDYPDYRYDLSETLAMVDIPGPFSFKAPDPASQQRSREMLEKALEISEELVAGHPNIPDYAVSQVYTRLKLAALLRETDRPAAESSLRKARDLQATLVRRFPRTSSYRFWMAVVDESLASLFEQQGRWSEARPALEDSIACLKELLRLDPKPSPIPRILAHHYGSLADLLHRMGDEQGAAEALHQAEQLRPRR
jgi:tetratricopeptide (TPR) repeat protein